MSFYKYFLKILIISLIVIPGVFAFIIPSAIALQSKDSIEIKVIQDQQDKINAQILSFDKQGQHYDDLRNVQLIGKKQQKDNKVEIIWQEVELNNKKKSINEPFASKVKVANKVETGDQFSATGSYSSLVSAIEELLQEQQQDKNINKKLNNNYSNSSTSESPYSYQSNSRPLSAYKNEETSDQEQIITDEQGNPITTDDGCSPYVNYELNQVFVQQRVIRDGEEIQGCHNSETNFALEKDYDICPDKQDLISKINQVYFQY